MNPPRRILSAAIHVNPRSTFGTGFNLTGTREEELVECMPDGRQRVLLVGISPRKADALALILNSPEGPE